MNRTFTLLACVYTLGTMVSFGQTLERQVIASAGTANPNGYTIGEVIAATENLQITTGFQQGQALEEDPTLGITDITTKLTVYPVPTKDFLTVQGNDLATGTTNVNVFSPDGRKVSIGIQRESNKIQLDLSQLSAGYYFLKLKDNLNQKVANYQILKLK